MAGGLFASLYGKQGIYEDLYSRNGASPPLHSSDLRLGGLGEDDEETEEVKAPIAPLSVGPTPSKGFFHTHLLGLPTWLLGLILLGFAATYRRKTKK